MNNIIYLVNKNESHIMIANEGYYVKKNCTKKVKMY